MVTSNYILQSVPVFVRWTARTVGFLLVILVVAITIGEGVPNPASLNATELALMVALLAILVGLALGFFREGWGGLVALAGCGLFWVLNDRRGFGVLNAAALVGTSYVFCWWCERRIKGQKS